MKSVSGSCRAQADTAADYFSAIEIGTLTLAGDVVMQSGDLIRSRPPHDHLLH